MLSSVKITADLTYFTASIAVQK